MSDRRSFSEISRELLREQADQARVDRIWERLDRDLVAGARSSRGARRVRSVAFAMATFALGTFVGARFFAKEPAPTPMFAAEPGAPLPGAAAAEHATTPVVASPEGHHENQPSRRTLSPRRTDLAVPAVPLSEAEGAPQATPFPDWRRLADEGQYAQALSALEASGGFDAALRDATADQIMSLVDVARATGQRERAITALRRVVSEHGSDPNAPVAAWMLGNELAKAHDLASAEQAFAMYRALSPGGDFAEDALARQLDMAMEQGHLEHARKLSLQYIKEFPNGPRTAEIQAQLDLSARAAEVSAVAPGHPQKAAPDGGAPR